MPDRHAELAGRLREIREDLWGEHGAQFLADAVGVPLRTWLHYESGVVMPGTILLRFLEATGACPHWLLTGQGPRYTRLRAGSRQGPSRWD